MKKEKSPAVMQDENRLLLQASNKAACLESNMAKYKLNEESRRELLLAELRKIDKENIVKNFPDKVCELIAEVRKLRVTISTVAFLAIATAIYKINLPLF